MTGAEQILSFFFTLVLIFASSCGMYSLYLFITLAMKPDGLEVGEPLTYDEV